MLHTVTVVFLFFVVPFFFFSKKLWRNSSSFLHFTCLNSCISLWFRSRLDLMETIESQTQQELLYKGLENYAETRGSEAAPTEIHARAMLEAVAEAAIAQAATQWMLALQDEDTTDTTLQAKVQKTDSDGFEVVRNPVIESQSKKIAQDQSDKILQKMTQLFESMQSLGTKKDLSVKNLETHMKKRFFEGRSSKETRTRKP